MIVIGKESSGSSSKNKSERNQNKAEGLCRDDVEIVEIPVTSTAESMSAENRATVDVRVFNLNDHHRTDLFVRMVQMEEPGISLRDMSLSHISSLYASIRMCSFDYFHGTLSVTFLPVVSAEDVTTLSTAGMTAARLVLNNDGKSLLL